MRSLISGALVDWPVYAFNLTRSDDRGIIIEFSRDYTAYVQQLSGVATWETQLERTVQEEMLARIGWCINKLAPGSKALVSKAGPGHYVMDFSIELVLVDSKLKYEGGFLNTDQLPSELTVIIDSMRTIEELVEEDSKGTNNRYYPTL